MKAYKVSLSGGKRSGSYTVRDLADGRAFFTHLNSLRKGSTLPKFPEHQLTIPAGGYLEDFILGDLSTPFVSQRARWSLESVAAGKFEFIPLGVLDKEEYFVLVVRPGLLCLDAEKSEVSEFSVSRHVFDERAIADQILFRIKGYPKVLYGTERFGELANRDRLTGVYLRDPDILLREEKPPFGLPCLKSGKRPITRG